LGGAELGIQEPGVVLESLDHLRVWLRPFVDLLQPSTTQVLGHEFYGWLWLSGSLIVIDLFYRIAHRSASEPFWSYSAPFRIYFHRSAILDYKFFLVQKLVIAFVTVPMLLWALALGRWGASVLLAWLGPEPQRIAGPGILVVFGVADLILFDVGHFISHYIQHKTAFFWEFHKIHHAAEVLTPITSFRVHPVESILDIAVQAPLQALALSVFYYWYGIGQSAMTLVWISMVYPLFYLVDTLRHSHLWISFGSKLEHVLSSPVQHQVHHSTLPQHVDTNFSRYFSFLDWLAGTLYIPKQDEALMFGLSEGPDPELETVWGLYWMPLKRAFRLLRAIRPPVGA
jgi:sterol desaturase/sphingolipid hydroxylase (fatty acid hydroxylase superfamily)